MWRHREPHTERVVYGELQKELGDQPDAELNLVTKAAALAAQTVAAIHRRRLVAQSFVAGLVAAAIICVPIVVITSNNNRDQARINSLYNCRLFKTTADTMADFVETDANLRARELHLTGQEQIITKENEIFGKTAVGRILKEDHDVNQNAIDHWRGYDISRLRAIQRADCRNALH